jgi:hypothetical protein
MSTANNPAPSEQDADSLDLLAETSANIRDLLSTWYALSPSQYSHEDAVTPARDRGTAGKEIMEQSALRLAAVDDVARVLRRADEGTLALVLDRNSVAVRRITARLDDLSRGVSAIDLRYSDEFKTTCSNISTGSSQLGGVNCAVHRSSGVTPRYILPNVTTGTRTSLRWYACTRSMTGSEASQGRRAPRPRTSTSSSATTRAVEGSMLGIAIFRCSKT